MSKRERENDSEEGRRLSTVTIGINPHRKIDDYISRWERPACGLGRPSDSSPGSSPALDSPQPCISPALDSYQPCISPALDLP